MRVEVKRRRQAHVRVGVEMGKIGARTRVDQSRRDESAIVVVHDWRLVHLMGLLHGMMMDLVLLSRNERRLDQELQILVHVVSARGQ